MSDSTIRDSVSSLPPTIFPSSIKNQSSVSGKSDTNGLVISLPSTMQGAGVAEGSGGLLGRMIEKFSFAEQSVLQAVCADKGKGDGSVVQRACTFAQEVSQIYRFLSSNSSTLPSSVDANGPLTIAERMGVLGEEYIRKVVAPSLHPSLLRGLGIEIESATKGATASMLGSSPSSVTGRMLGAAGVAYVAYDLFKDYGRYSPVDGAIRGAAAGAYVGTHILPGVGTGLGGVIGGAIGTLGGLFQRSGKGAEQLERDQIRLQLQMLGVIDGEYSLRLADGTRYGIGADGGTKLQNVDGSSRNAYDVDFSHPFAGVVVGMANPLALLVTVERFPDRQSDIAGYFVNAALSNATNIEEARANMAQIYGSFGVDPEVLLDSVEEIRRVGRISESDAQAYVQGIASLFRPITPSDSQEKSRES